RTGDPFLAPPSFYFPSDDALFQQNLDFMTGPYILAAPIAEPDMRERTVRLPPGWWYDPASSTWHRGQQGIRAAAPLDRIPVFIREGSIIPRGPVIQHTREQASEFDLDVYPGADTAFSLYDDDGLSMDYTRGTFARTQFTLTHGLAGITLAARRSGGMTPPRRTWSVTVHRIQEQPRAITLNGRPAAGWTFDSRTRQIRGKLEGDGSDFTLVVRP
ncbi:MAG: DUF5110 domain-containing protein, partial [Acidobacteria bacterium]|nr:DUF5110 domain-containing protein [Acidobacteriota bacterium]